MPFENIPLPAHNGRAVATIGERCAEKGAKYGKEENSPVHARLKGNAVGWIRSVK